MAALRISSWRRYIEGVSVSPQAIFRSITEELEDRDMPGLIITRAVHREGGIYSRKRWYLVVQWREHVFRVSAIPFARGMVISWYLEEHLNLFWRFAFIVPPLGKLLIRIFRPDSPARIDRNWTFQTVVHSAILDVLDAHLQARGLRTLADKQARPILSDPWGRASANGR